MAKKKDVTVAGEQEPQRLPSTIEDMNRFFDQMMGSFMRHRWPAWLKEDWPSLGGLGSLWEPEMPRVDVVNRDEEVEVTAELPGVSKDDLEVTLGDNSITIQGSTSQEEKTEEGEYFRREISRGSFSRTVTLPSEVDGENVKASFDKGVLSIRLPKLAPSKRRKIEVD